jgi:hypothetical protein
VGGWEWGVGESRRESLAPTPDTPHPTPDTPHPTPDTPHPTPPSANMHTPLVT